MRTVTGIFGNDDAANKAADALKEAGIAGDDITVDASDNGEIVLGARAENELVDTVHAILSQSGAKSVEEVKASFEANGQVDEDDVEAEERARFDPIPLVIAPIPR